MQSEVKILEFLTFCLNVRVREFKIQRFNRKHKSGEQNCADESFVSGNSISLTPHSFNLFVTGLMLLFAR